MEQTSNDLISRQEERTNKRTETHACDSISRQGAIDFVGSMEMCDEISAEAYQKLTNYLEELPPEQPKKGKWIVYKAPDAYHCGLCKCPFCGEEMIAEADEYNFCPKCGADMRGETDERKSLAVE